MKILKNLLPLLLALSLLLSAAPALAEGADIQCQGMPDEVRSFFAQSQFGGALVGPNGGVLIENTPGGSFYFAVTQKEGHNTLYGFEKKNGKYQYWLVTDAAVPQGDAIFALGHHSGQHYMTFFDSPIFVGDTLSVIYTRPDYEEQADSAVWFEVNQNGQWNVTWTFFDYCWDGAQVGNDNVTYYLDEGYSKTVIQGVVERNLRYFSWADFPKNLKDAKEKLTMPPAIPTGELTAQRIKFEGGQKFPVYSGPGEQYQRLGNGKAAVSTNDWIQVFGSENGYILIQYDISSTQMRVGWIDQSALPRGASVSPLRFAYQDADVVSVTFLTDDPFVGQGRVRTLNAGQRVTKLAVSGDWVYVEIADQTAPIRGFMPAQAIKTEENEARQNAAGGRYEAAFANGVYSAAAQVTVTEQGMISASVRVTGPAAWAESGADAVAGYQLYANNVPLAVLSIGGKNPGDWDYTFTASAALPEKATLVGLCPVHAQSGLKAEEMITLSLESGKAPGVPDNYAVVNNPNPAERLHLRRSATAASPSLGKYYSGTQVALIVGGQEYEGFSHVRIGSVEGYMMTEYLAFGAAAGQVRDARPTVTVQNAAGTGLNLRTAPSIDGAVLQLLKNGVQVTVMGLTEDWLHVSFNGQTGYIAATGVTPRLSYDLYTGGTSTGSARRARITADCSVYSSPENLGYDAGDPRSNIVTTASAGSMVSVYQVKNGFAQVGQSPARWVHVTVIEYSDD